LELLARFGVLTRCVFSLVMRAITAPEILGFPICRASPAPEEELSSGAGLFLRFERHLGRSGDASQQRAARRILHIRITPRTNAADDLVDS
jgi:hypothetical protein